MGKFKDYFYSKLDEKYYKVEDFNIGDLITFKDGEVWEVVKSGVRRPDSRKKDDEITIKPYNDKAKKSNISLAIDIDEKNLNTNIVKVDKK